MAPAQMAAAPEEDFAAFLAAAQDALAWRGRQAKGRAEMQALLDGPKHPFDAEATYQRYQEKYGWNA